MKYMVVWKPATLDDLAALWNEAADRNAIASAADTIDALLRTRPHTFGQVRSGNLREAVVPPLGIDFQIVDDDRLVYVLAVWTAADPEAL